MLIDLPEFINCEVNLEFVSNQKGWEKCYIFAVTCIPSRPPMFTIHTENGAVFSRLPIWAFRHKETGEAPDQSVVCPWACVGSSAVVIKHAYLKDYTVEYKGISGRYLFTIDYFNGNFSEDPEQHKTHNVIALDNGLFAALPNNYCIFKDKHFINKNLKTNHYKRQTKYHTAD